MSDDIIPDDIIPDEKDWTWVLATPCPECGYRSDSVEVSETGPLIRENTAVWLEVLRRDDVRRRPSTAIWSPLEYACHVRDVHVLYLQRLEMMLEQDGPHYPNWDQDATAVAERYHEADPRTVAEQLVAAAGALADRFDRVRDDEWARTGHRSDGAAFTVTTFARYFLHDPVHHLHDVGASST
ncbi:MAG: DinB family protein [Acidimicrobiales bacterium]